MESRNASFFENIFLCRIQEGVPSSMKEVEGDNDQVDDQDEEVDEPRRNKRARTAKSFGSNFLTYMLEGEPRTFHEAMTPSESLYGKKQSRVKLTLSYRIILGSWLI